MFYKVILNGMVVDIQTELRYVRWQEANNLMIMCSEEMANGILSSDSSVIWHVEGFPEFPDGLCQTVIVEEIEEDEYLRWKERLPPRKQRKLPKSRLPKMQPPRNPQAKAIFQFKIC